MTIKKLIKTFIMKYSKFLFMLLIAFFTAMMPIFSQNNSNSATQAIQKVIQEAYIDGVFNLGDTLAIAKGFHDEFRLLGQQPEGGLRIVSKADWLQSVKDKLQQGKYPTSKAKQVRANFLAVDVIENMAFVKLEFLIGNEVHYIDFLTLYYFEDGWKIMHKVYHQMQK